MRSGTSPTSRLTSFWRRGIRLQWPRGLAIAFCGMIGTLLPAIYGHHAGVREPVVHDEFSYLLAADTFAHGRLSNPSPAHPEFFEAPHILVVPAYCSKYPPGQGLILAVGQLLGGKPIWGVWLSCGLFAAALCWMLEEWTSVPWAIATTWLSIATCGVSSYWAQSYWGGMVAAAGGALLFGGLHRMLRKPRVGSSLLMGSGVVVLANSRPYEGLLTCVAGGALLAFRLVVRCGPSWKTMSIKWGLPFFIVLVVGIGWMAFYNRAVTGNWLQSPYVLHQNQYFEQGVFRFSALRPPERRPAPHVAAFYAHYKQPVERGRSLIAGTVDALYRNLAFTMDWIFGMTLETHGAPFARPWFLVFIATIALFDRWVRFSIGTICFVVLGASVVWWCFPHYLAPIYPLGIAVLAVTLRRATWVPASSTHRGAWLR